MMLSTDANDKFISTESVDHTFSNGKGSESLLHFDLTFMCNSAYHLKNCIPSLLLDKGHFIALQATSLRGGYSARIQSGFINTTDTCLMLFYRVISYATLKVIAQNEELYEYEVRVVTINDMTDTAKIYIS